LATLRKGTLSVKIVSARGLKAADIGNTSDPYVVCMPLNGEGEACEVFGPKKKAFSWKTSVKKKRLSATWDESTTFRCKRKWQMVGLQIRVYDYDMLSTDDFLGEVFLSVDEIERDFALTSSSDHFKEVTRELEPRTGHRYKHEEVTGTITFALGYWSLSKLVAPPASSVAKSSSAPPAKRERDDGGAQHSRASLSASTSPPSSSSSRGSASPRKSSSARATRWQRYLSEGDANGNTQFRIAVKQDGQVVESISIATFVKLFDMSTLQDLIFAESQKK
jgi:C2 domain